MSNNFPAQAEANEGKERLLLEGTLLELTITRLAWQVFEDDTNFEDTVVVGLQPRGVFFAKRLHQRLQEISQRQVPFGFLDATFYRDDFRRREHPTLPNQTHIPFVLEGKRVILVDDVLYTGRTIRAALDAMIAYGRPQQVDLVVLIERRYSRELPIDAQFIGKQVNSLPSQRVKVKYTDQGFAEDSVWLVTEN